MGYSNRTWMCPFFVWDEMLAIHCEGGRLTFKDREQMLEYIDRHCACLQGWKNCSMAISLEKYYERTD